jgi:toxin-antitoxin system PIN domain toxin
VIAVDSNLLVYAHRRDSPFFEAAGEAVRELAESPAPWAIPWPCVHEFFAIVTHHRIYDPPSTIEQATAQAAAWLASPSVRLLAETPGYWPVVERLLAAGRVAGPMVHDARVAALCLHHGVRELWSADRDFSRFPELRVRNPLVGATAPGDPSP